MSFADFFHLDDPAAVNLLSPSASEWLRARLAEADAATADQITGTASLATEVSPGLAGELAGADQDPAFVFASAGDAQEAQGLAGQLCQRCALQTRCPEAACRIFRVEQAAIDFQSNPSPDAAI